MTLYFDYNATTPVLPEVADLVYKMMVEEFGNADSRTHEFGVNAKRAVEVARSQVAEVVRADKTEVIFTSGATESNNIAILGLREFAEVNGRKHIITSKIEHKAVLEPVGYLEKNGFEVTYLNVSEGGQVDLAELKAALRDDTVLVSIMHINNETGVVQPITEICELLAQHEAYLHVDAAQSFGKYPFALDNTRIDFISSSGHKLYAPKGIGALILRRRGFTKPPLKPLIFGGGQEKGLRPGTLPVALIAGYGKACELAKNNVSEWIKSVQEQKKFLLDELKRLGGMVNGDNSSPYTVNISIPGVNSEAAMVKLKGIVAVSNGSACSSNSYKPSHVLKAMNLSEERIAEAIRFSFSPHFREVPAEAISQALETLM